MSEETKNPWMVWTICAVLAAGLIVVITDRRGLNVNEVPAPPEEVEPVDHDAAKLTADKMLEEQKRLDDSLWADEVAAQRYEKPIVEMWDRLRGAEDPWEILASMPFEDATWSMGSSGKKLQFGLESAKFDGKPSSVPRAEAQGYLRSFRRRGFKLEQSEWHHAKFERSTNGPSRSVFNVSLHVSAPGDRRIALKGKLGVEWKPEEGTNSTPVIARVSVNDLSMVARTGKPAFQEYQLPLWAKLRVALPVLAHDMTGDGLTDIVMPAHNVIVTNKGGFKFDRMTLMELFPEGLSTEQMMVASGKMAAVVDEFTGDELPDLVVALPPYGVFLYAMQTNRRFSAAPKRIVAPGAKLEFPSVITTGDINGDGRTDLWVGQYKESFFNGEMPDPIFDANSGYPAFLLVNQGEGKFEDMTDAAGLGEKRNRWTYSASFWDFDEDGDLDLITVNDYSGVDAYENDGKGRFKTVTKSFIDERANFGMGHAIADINRDSRMDFFVTGMSSTTARRLDALGLGREEFPDVQKLRARMAYGNRVYLGQGQGIYRQPMFKDQLARTGWSWGVGVLDFGNDGWPDLYIANGHISNETCRDYCTRFWTHDIYVDNTSDGKQARVNMFNEVNRDWLNAGVSWNGFEKNVLFLNHGGRDFVSAGWAMGVSFEYDSRSVLVEDFDNDGRQDLLIGKHDSTKQRAVETVHLYRNQWEQNGNWIGVTLQPGKGMSAVGTRMLVESSLGKQVAVVVTGDSFYTQHPARRLFGLGEVNHVRRLTVTFPNGKVKTIDHPRINQYHVISAD